MMLVADRGIAKARSRAASEAIAVLMYDSNVTPN